jgi:hypothetical protein
MTHGVFDVVAEHPQEHHIRRQVQNVCVQEHIGDEGQRFRDRNGIEGSMRRSIHDADLKQLGGNHRQAAACS